MTISPTGHNLLSRDWPEDLRARLSFAERETARPETGDHVLNPDLPPYARWEGPPRDAAVLIGVQFDDKVLETALGARRVRKLILFARYSENPNTISICCDDRAAMSTITDYVIGKGYERPLFLAGPQTVSAHLLRKETFLNQWFEEKHMLPEYTSVAAYDPELACARVTEYLTGMPAEDRPDILVCENDALAMGAIDAIRYNLGLRVPEDIAVTGFDNTPQGANPNYDLTSYRQPLTAMAEKLVEILKGETDTTAVKQFSGELMPRNSA